LIGCDANAHSPMWWSTTRDRRGREIEDFVIEQGLGVTNRPSPFTTLDGARGATNIDVVLAGGELVERVAEWRVVPGVSDCDHNYVAFELQLGGSMASASREISGYSLKRMDEGLLKAEVRAGLERAVSEGGLGGVLDSEEAVDERVRLLTDIIWEAFVVATPKKRRPPWRRSVPWWTPELMPIKRAFYRARKKRFRSVLHMVDFEEKRGAWVTAYRRAKRESWKKVCSESSSPWGLTYRVLKGSTSNLVSTVKGADGKIISDPEASVRFMMNSFWPEDTEGDEQGGEIERLRCEIEERAREYEGWCRRALPDQGEPLYSQEEVRRVVGRSRGYKAPGPDMICGKLLEVLCDELLPNLAELYNAGLTLGYFARPWKGDLEVALGKPGKKDFTVYKAYRMLSLTNEMGKDQVYL
ncbi:unnamed protein product, partial [Heterosigma akashiwo]